MKHNPKLVKEFYLQATPAGFVKSKKYMAKLRKSFYPVLGSTIDILDKQENHTSTWGIDPWSDLPHQDNSDIDPQYGYHLIYKYLCRSSLLKQVKKSLEEEQIIQGLELPENKNDSIGEIFANDWVANFATIKFGKFAFDELIGFDTRIVLVK